MVRKRIYKLKWIRARRKMHELLHQLLQMNKTLKKTSTYKVKAPKGTHQNRIKLLNMMLRQQAALVRFYEGKVKK